MSEQPREFLYDTPDLRVYSLKSNGGAVVFHEGYSTYLPPEAVAAIARAHAERQRQVLVGADWLSAVEGFIPRHLDEESQ